MKILEVCHFSAGICGVWSRVREESLRLSERGHEVRIFSSNFTKGTNERAPQHDKLGSIPIIRFPATHLGGEAFIHWTYEREALAFEPDVIMVHNYRQLHTTRALSIARKLRKKGVKTKVFLVTHAPFVEGNITRSFIATQIVKLYDAFVGPRTLNKFDGVITISHWEIPFLRKMGVKKNKIHYIPNGIPEEFLSTKIKKGTKKILFLGRVAPKKKLETLIQAVRYLKDTKTIIEIVGPPEKEYFAFLKGIITQFNLGKRIHFSKPIYELKPKLAKIDSCTIYVLPSRVEGMPQSLIEAMAREKIVVGSDSMAIRDLIKDGKNGYLFEFDNPQDLARILDKALAQKTTHVQKEARRNVGQFSWPRIVSQIEALITR